MGCTGACALHHACPCPDKARRHPGGGVLDVPLPRALAVPEGEAGLEETGGSLDDLVTRVVDALGLGRSEAREAVRAALEPPPWTP